MLMRVMSRIEGRSSRKGNRSMRRRRWGGGASSRERDDETVLVLIEFLLVAGGQTCQRGMVSEYLAEPGRWRAGEGPPDICPDRQAAIGRGSCAGKPERYGRDDGQQRRRDGRRDASRPQ